MITKGLDVKVLYDTTPLLPKKITGVGIYVRNLFRGLRGLGVDVNAVYQSSKLIKENSIDTHIQSSPKVFRAMFSPKNSIIHSTDVNLLSDSPKFKKVITIHDMTMFRDDMMDSRLAKKLQEHMKAQLNCNPDAIIVPSYEVHSEFLIRFPKFMNKVNVVYHGSDHLIDSDSLQRKAVTDKPYFLYVGTIEKKKNLVNIIKAFEGFCSLEEETQLVIVGGDGYGADGLNKLISSSPNKSRIIKTGYLQNASLKKLYANAIGLVFPSLYEGFGLQIVEAMKMGCPVITSSVGVMAELGREHSHIVNPMKPEQIMGAMERFVFDKNYRGKLITQGTARTEKMTWLECARETAAVYNKI